MMGNSELFRFRPDNSISLGYDLQKFFFSCSETAPVLLNIFWTKHILCLNIHVKQSEERSPVIFQRTTQRKKMLQTYNQCIAGSAICQQLIRM